MVITMLSTSTRWPQAPSRQVLSPKASKTSSAVVTEGRWLRASPVRGAAELPALCMALPRLAQVAFVSLSPRPSAVPVSTQGDGGCLTKDNYLSIKSYDFAQILLR